MLRGLRGLPGVTWADLALYPTVSYTRFVVPNRGGGVGSSIATSFSAARGRTGPRRARDSATALEPRAAAGTRDGGEATAARSVRFNC